MGTFAPRLFVKLTNGLTTVAEIENDIVSRIVFISSNGTFLFNTIHSE